ncbi:MAG: hypothetical protein ACLFNT_14115 [Spirochaetales bacterium]
MTRHPRLHPPVRCFVFLIGLVHMLAGIGSLNAQTIGQAEASEAAARRVLAVIHFEDTAGFDLPAREHMRSSLISTLTRQQAEAVIILHQGEAPENDGELTATASAAGSSAWLFVAIDGDTNSPRYRAVAFDLVARKYLFEIEGQAEQEPRTRDLAKRYWSEIATLLDQTLQTVIPGTEIHFEGAPGTTISGITDEPIVLDGDGRASRVLINPNYHEYRANRIGFYPVEGVLIIGDAPATVRLDQIEATRNTIDFGLTTLNFPTFTYRYDVIPQWIFAGTSLTSYSLGFSFADRGNGAGILVTLPLQELRVIGGGFFLPVDAPIRPYGALFVGTRLVTASQFFGLDPLTRVQAGLHLGAEFPLRWSLTGYVEWFPTMFFSSEPDLLFAAYPLGMRPLITQTEIGHIEYEGFRVGVRWRW